MENKQIDDLLNSIDNLPREQQIEHLKKLSNMINNKNEDLEKSFIVGTFLSGCGFGIMSSSNSLLEFYMSLGILSSGVILSLMASQKTLKKEKTKSLKIKKR